MAPRVRSGIVDLLLAKSVCSQCLRRAQPRLFSSTPHKSTRLRQSMFRWLNGPGAAFKDPLPGSTNYLNAYDSNGNLIRARGGSKTRPSDQNDPERASGNGDRSESVSREQNIASGQSIPGEQPDDLMPFPMNRQFRSQPVLSEELRDEIYRRIVEESKSVRTVSSELGVEMRRVGAVFRLMSIENQWIQEVSHFPISRCKLGPTAQGANDSNDEPNNIRLVLKTSTMVIIQTNYNSLKAIAKFP